MHAKVSRAHPMQVLPKKTAKQKKIKEDLGWNLDFVIKRKVKKKKESAINEQQTTIRLPI